jgi:serine/threonine-protein kinase RsbW
MSGRNVVTLTMPAKTEYLVLARLALAGIAREVPMDETVLADLKLAVTEACGNAVRHANTTGQGGVCVRFEMTDEAIEISVEDEGAGTPPVLPAGAPEAEGLFHADDLEDLSEGGMGLAIIRAIVDELEIDGRDGAPGTVVRMRKHLVPA